MRVYNGDNNEYYIFRCDCGQILKYTDKLDHDNYCPRCGKKQDWSKIYKMENELDRRCNAGNYVKYFAMYGPNISVGDDEV